MVSLHTMSRYKIALRLCGWWGYYFPFCAIKAGCRQFIAGLWLFPGHQSKRESAGGFSASDALPLDLSGLFVVVVAALVYAVLVLIQFLNIRGQSRRSCRKEAVKNSGGLLRRKVRFKVLYNRLAVRGGDFQSVADKRLNGADVRHKVGFDVCDILNVFATRPKSFCGLPAQIVGNLAGQINPGAVGADEVKNDAVDSHC